MDWMVQLSNSGKRKIYSSLKKNVQTDPGAHPASFTGVKRLERKINHSIPSSVEVKNE